MQEKRSDESLYDIDIHRASNRNCRHRVYVPRVVQVNKFDFKRLGTEPPQTDHKQVVVLQVIRTTNLTRGTGVTNNPIRRITQYWSLDGELLAENDPYSAAG